ncbi:lytic transglycosylase domain-containing protein [Sphingobium soli]|uniref:Lytic transglycosylase domain-containing protein n=1 Tax=Sphingobium soli TaxID=1591116 RepID=A0ABS8H4X3_9SPHN|nr:lytic transglycosylase domain-containing protein [Sphingobium soli]MCC4232631.1 lytic transglycosylase domain-containing protein [Sphingobium soli]
MSRHLRRRAIRFAFSLLIAGYATAAFPVASSAQNVAPRASALHPYAAHVGEASARFGLPEDLIWAVMRAESAGNPRALSPAGAMGLMQIMPATWRGLTARHGLGTDAFEVRANILAGAAYLRAMFDRYGDLTSMLAAYNAGPRRVDDWRAGGRSLPPETVAYVARIAPAMGVSSVTSSARPAAVLPDWRSAMLFTARSDGASERTAAAQDAPPTRIAMTAPAPRSAASPAGSNALFVPLSGQVAR